jgi:hypothetical protein
VGRDFLCRPAGCDRPPAALAVTWLRRRVNSCRLSSEASISDLLCEAMHSRVEQD